MKKYIGIKESVFEKKVVPNSKRGSVPYHWFVFKQTLMMK